MTTLQDTLQGYITEEQRLREHFLSTGDRRALESCNTLALALHNLSRWRVDNDAYLARHLPVIENTLNTLRDIEAMDERRAA